MSIYSGFATRALETGYNKLVYKMLFIIQMKLHRINTSQPVDEALLTKHFCTLYRRMVSMEEHKHMMPKFSFALNNLAVDYGLAEESGATVSQTNFSLEEESRDKHSVERSPEQNVIHITRATKPSVLQQSRAAARYFTPSRANTVTNPTVFMSKTPSKPVVARRPTTSGNPSSAKGCNSRQLSLVHSTWTQESIYRSNQISNKKIRIRKKKRRQLSTGNRTMLIPNPILALSSDSPQYPRSCAFYPTPGFFPNPASEGAPSVFPHR